MVKNSPANEGDVGSIPRSVKSPGGGNDNPLQYSSLENSMGRGAWWATVHGVTKSQTQLKDEHFLSFSFFSRNVLHLTIGLGLNGQLMLLSSLMALISILQMRRPRTIERKWVNKGHTASKWSRFESNHWDSALTYNHRLYFLSFGSLPSATVGQFSKSPFIARR